MKNIALSELGLLVDLL